MDNFTRIKTQKFFSLAALLFSAFLLQACGAREEPFNADPDGRGENVEATTLNDGDGVAPPGVTDYSSKLIILEDTLKFQTYWRNYTNTEPDPTVNFAIGQVVLIDTGRVTGCDSKSAVEDVKAYEYGDDNVQVVVD